MSRHGWQPGETLGVKDSAHSKHFTNASHTHIRVSRKDDNLGLGARARRPLEDNEPTGLDAFQGLLGRLNGKSDAELQKEQRKVEDRRLLSYVERRWKTMQFVSGGFLVQDKDKKEEDEVPATEKKIKSVMETAEEDIESTTTKRRSKDKKEKKDSSKSKKDKKSKKDRRKKDSDSSTSTTPDDSSDEATPAPDSESTTKEKSKKSRKERKKRKAEDEENTAKAEKTDAENKSSKSPEPSAPAVPAPPRNLKGRHVLRGRYIQSKRMATLDDKSLNEVWIT